MTIAYNANYIETMPFSNTCIQVNCGASVQQTWTVPGSSEKQYQAYFEYAANSNVFVRLNGVPALPGTGSVSQQSYSEFKPKKRYVHGGDVLHFITPDTNAYIGVSLRQIQG